MQMLKAKVATEPNTLTDAIDPQRHLSPVSKAVRSDAMRLPSPTA
jgi:hypothetical protein